MRTTSRSSSPPQCRMLKLQILGDEYYDEEHECFVTNGKPITLNLEHSLISVSLWESKYKKPFLKKSKDEIQMTPEELKYYIQCMTLNKDVDPTVYDRLTTENVTKILEYIDDSMTATWFNDKNSKKAPQSGKATTSELIYYWMIANGIPFECQKWHLNRLITLIRVCNAEGAPAKKMSKKDIMAQNAALNKMRRAKHHTKG